MYTCMYVGYTDAYSLYLYTYVYMYTWSLYHTHPHRGNDYPTHTQGNHRSGLKTRGSRQSVLHTSRIRYPGYGRWVCMTTCPCPLLHNSLFLEALRLVLVCGVRFTLYLYPAPYLLLSREALNKLKLAL